MSTTRNFNAEFEGTLITKDLDNTTANVDNLVPGCVVTWDTGEVVGATGTSNKTLGLCTVTVIADPGTDKGFVKPIDPTIAYPDDKTGVYVDGGIYRYVMGMEDTDGRVVMPSGLSIGDYLQPHTSYAGCFEVGSSQKVLMVTGVTSTEAQVQLLV